ncbi:hypothetical protein C2I18_16435 [Paenibacillus sp. PK3_47]|uniref:DUF1648 domain-containing protein n=1 Tax=Paenibacillus sp. PK3_47 TaxID=2072642 RepID=UPI00201E6C69|nr:DUF1648 domain-containing protein [Paenibacillus sp. PK3_47]UQZ34968.1 hypothetical protein C2I18_16435 [Paenibacillus sp. PK3_47]
MFKRRLTMSLSIIAAMIPFILYLFLYPRMPVFVPIHYNGDVADRFVNKSSVEVLLLSLLGWFGFIVIRLLRFALTRMFFRSYIENLAVLHRIWNAAALLVTLGFASISVCALFEMV